MKCKIGNVTLDNNVIVAPMAGVTDLPFRMLCKEQGCGMVCTEMVSAKAIFHHNKNTETLLEIEDKEKPVSLQLFGNDPYIMSEMAKRIEPLHFAVLDINMGCPVPKIVNNGEGSALLRTPKLAGEIIEAIVGAIKKPVTVKIRKGFDAHLINAPEIARIAQESGAGAIIVHGRTREQYYSGKADWSIIRKVKAHVNIPVIGNGDIKTPKDAEAMIQQTGCDGIMIGRGVQGNPWLFREINEYLDTGKIPERPTLDEVIHMILRHTEDEIAYADEYMGIRRMRKHIAWYTAGYPDSAKLRNQVNQIDSFAELKYLLLEYAYNCNNSYII